MSRLASHSGKKLILMIIIVAVLVVVLGGGAVLGARLLKHGKGDKDDKHAKSEKTEKVAKADKTDKAEDADAEEAEEAASAKTDDQAEADEEAEAGDETDKADESAKKGEGEQPEVVSLGDFLVNLTSGSGVRYLRAEVSIGVTGLPAAKGGHGGAKAPALPPGELAIARDRVVSILSAGDFAQLRTVAGRDQLKQKLLGRLQKALPKYELSEVLFTSFVMQ